MFCVGGYMFHLYGGRRVIKGLGVKICSCNYYDRFYCHGCFGQRCISFATKGIYKEFGGVERIADQQFIQQRRKTALLFFQRIAPDSLEAYDYDMLANYVAEVKKDNEIVGAVFFNKENRAVTRGEEQGAGNRIIKLSKPVIKGEDQIGRVELYLSREAVDNKIAVIRGDVSRSPKEIPLRFYCGCSSIHVASGCWGAHCV